MKRALPIILIVLGLVIGFLGITKLDDSGGSVEIGNLELSAENSDTKTQAYLLIGGSIICLVLGVGGVAKGK